MTDLNPHQLLGSSPAGLSATVKDGHESDRRCGGRAGEGARDSRTHRCDADLLEESLKKAGVKVEHKVYDGVMHEFFGMAAVVDDAKDAQKWAGKRLKQAFEHGADERQAAR